MAQPPASLSVQIPETDFKTGLTTPEVAERIAAGQSNRFKSDTSRSWWSIIRSNVFTLFNGIVLACFTVLLLLGRWQDALFGLAAIANAIIGCFQEIKAKIALDRLALLHASKTRVRRNSEDLEIMPSDVVLGDILVLRAGDQIPADAVVVKTKALQIDESMLTGESDPVDKNTGDDALSASIVVGGEGFAVVTKVGADTYANKFADEAKMFSMASSELRRGINRVLKWVAWGIGPIGLLVVNAQIQVQGGWSEALRSGTWQQAVVDSTAVITAMVPLGLVLLTSIAFVVGAARLGQQQVLVQELAAVEGLARVDVVCTDKTGTLTVGEISYDNSYPLPESANLPWQDVLAWFGATPDANATARSIAKGFRVTTPLEADQTITFSSARKWSAASFAEGAASGTWVLGAPSMIFAETETVRLPWQGDAAASDGTANLQDIIVELSRAAKRVVLLTHSPETLSEADADAQQLIGNLRPVALVTLEEQIRPDAEETVAYFAKQNVNVKIISGDSPHTVAAIARKIGIDAEDGYDARELPMDDAEALADALENNTVFGRVSPEQKKGMVIALQHRGHTVAMTGDGVNDALAIKQADIGIAMNSGSPATKAVARLVLLDNSFSHLPEVVAEGRRVIANIERVSMLFLSKTMYATTIAVLFGVLMMQIPFLPRQLSITDGLTIGIPAFFLALLPNAQRYVPGFLRRSLSFAIPAGAVVALGLLTLSIFGLSWGAPMEQIRTASTLVVAILGLWILLMISLPLSWFKVGVIVAMIAGLVLIMNLPITVWFFELVLPSPELLALVAGIGIIGVILISLARAIQQRYLRKLDEANTLAESQNPA